MVDRIRKILETKQLTPTQFADVIGIARPIISHILSGRNKPSLEVVQKIIAAFPDLAMPWLLTGTGPMSAIPSVSEPGQAGTQPKKPAVKEPKMPLQAQQDLAFGTRAQTVPSAATESRFALASEGAVSGVPGLAMAELIQPASQPPVASQQAFAVPSQTSTGATLTAAGVSSSGPTIQATASPATLPLLPAVPVADKPIRRIVIFYQDGTFSDFQPER